MEDYTLQPAYVRTLMTPQRNLWFLICLFYVVLILPICNNTLKILIFQEFTAFKHGFFIIGVWSFFTIETNLMHVVQIQNVSKQVLKDSSSVEESLEFLHTC